MNSKHSLSFPFKQMPLVCMLRIDCSVLSGAKKEEDEDNESKISLNIPAQSLSIPMAVASCSRAWALTVWRHPAPVRWRNSQARALHWPRTLWPQTSRYVGQRSVGQDERAAAVALANLTLDDPGLGYSSLLSAPLFFFVAGLLTHTCVFSW